MKNTDFKLEERERGEWWIVEGDGAHPATAYEVALWVNLIAARSEQRIPPTTWLGVLVLVIICGTILGSVYMIWGVC